MGFKLDAKTGTGESPKVIFRVEPLILRRLKNLSKKRKISISQLMRQVIRYYLDRNKK